MFVQVIQAPAGDAAGIRRLMDRWVAELADGAEGWLGSTAGVTDGGEFVATARFESEESARRNSGRTDQAAWWAELEKQLASPATFQDCRDAVTFLAGGSDDAGFVQVIQSRIVDAGRVRDLVDRMAELDAGDFGRDDVLGGIVAWDPQMVTEVFYFTSEAEARVAEAEPHESERAAALLAEWDAAVTDVRYLDLREPWLWSP